MTRLRGLGRPLRVGPVEVTPFHHTRRRGLIQDGGAGKKPLPRPPPLRGVGEEEGGCAVGPASRAGPGVPHEEPGPMSLFLAGVISIYRSAIQEAGGRPMMRACCFALLLVCGPAFADPVVTLPNARPRRGGGALSKKMLAGLPRFALRRVEASVKSRARLWTRAPSSRRAYEKSIEANRRSFRKI